MAKGKATRSKVTLGYSERHRDAAKRRKVEVEASEYRLCVAEEISGYGINEGLGERSIVAIDGANCSLN